MKRAFLEQLGIVDKDVVDKIMAENGLDIQREKGRWESAERELEETKNLLTQRESRISELEKTAGDIGELTKRVETLTTEKATLAEQHTKELGALRLNHGLESMARDSGARNVKAVLALLDHSKITMDGEEIKGAKEQFDALKAGEATEFLFNEAKPITGAVPAKGSPTPMGDPKPKDLGSAIASYYAKLAK